MTTEEQKRTDYNIPEMEERSKTLQQEALDDKEGVVFVVHKVNLEFIEKLDIKTAGEAWTAEEREQINKLTDPLSERVAEFVSKELENNDKLGLLKFKSGAGDFKAIVKLSELSSGIDGILKELLSLAK